MLDNEVVQDTANLEQVLDTTENTQPAVEDSSGETLGASQAQNQPQVKPPQEDHKNFRMLREKLEQERRERERMEQKLAELEARNKSSTPEEDLNFNLRDDEIAEGKHLTKVGRKIKELENKIAESERRRLELQQKSEENSIISSIKVDFPDIDKVVNEATMSALAAKYPHLERTIKSSPDLYSKAAAAYQAIKDLGIYTEDNYANERERVQRNVSKPKPSAAVSGSGSPLSQADMFANGLTQELKDKLHKEMLDAIKAR
jgi:hypothetical protein